MNGMRNLAYKRHQFLMLKNLSGKLHLQNNKSCRAARILVPRDAYLSCQVQRKVAVSDKLTEITAEAARYALNGSLRKSGPSSFCVTGNNPIVDKHFH